MIVGKLCLNFRITSVCVFIYLIWPNVLKYVFVGTNLLSYLISFSLFWPNEGGYFLWFSLHINYKIRS